MGSLRPAMEAGVINHLPRARQRLLRRGQGGVEVQLRRHGRNGAPTATPPARGGCRLPSLTATCSASTEPGTSRRRRAAIRCTSTPLHHPNGIGGPLWHAYDADDVAVPDLAKITGPLHAAERWHRILPAGPKGLWVTEISWDSDPPDPNGVPVQTQARWCEQAMDALWREGVGTILFLAIVDAPPIPNYASTYQSGIYYLDGQPKPSATAFRFCL